MTHTPTPWLIGDYHDVEGPDGELVHVKGFALSKRGEANAAFIVKAVNAHDKLVEALRQIANISYANYGRQNEKLADIEPIARAALEGLE